MTLNSFLPRTTMGWASATLVAAGAGYALSAHWNHALPFLPYLLILACPLMHLFMHGGHGSHGGHTEHNQNGTNSGAQSHMHGGSGCHSKHRPDEKAPSSQTPTING